jgi:MFS family permease
MLMWLPIYFISQQYVGSSQKYISKLIPSELRTTSGAIYFSFTTIFAGLGSLLIGFLADLIENNFEMENKKAFSIKISLLSVVILGYGLAAIFYLISLIFVSRDLKNVEKWKETNL